MQRMPVNLIRRPLNHKNVKVCFFPGMLFTFNPEQNIWNKLKNFNICFCVLFDCYCPSSTPGKETGHYAMPQPKFEILLIFPDFLKSYRKLIGNSCDNLFTKFAILDILLAANRTYTKILQSSKILLPGLLVINDGGNGRKRLI